MPCTFSDHTFLACPSRFSPTLALYISIFSVKYPGSSFQYFPCFNDPSHSHGLKYIFIEFHAYTFGLTPSPKLNHPFTNFPMRYISLNMSLLPQAQYIWIKLIFFLTTLRNLFFLFSYPVPPLLATGIMETLMAFSYFPWKALYLLHPKPKLTLLQCDLKPSSTHSSL